MPHPSEGLIRFVPYEYQGRFLVDESKAVLVVKARQIGFSQAVALKCLHRMLMRPGSTELVVSRNLDSAIEIRRYVSASCPAKGRDFAHFPGVRVVKANETSIVLSNGSRFEAEAGGPNAGRSFAASDVYLDEIDFQPFALQTYQSIGPTVSRGRTITVFSSPKGQNRILYQLWNGLYGGEQTWARYRIVWRDCPEFDDAWYARERPKYSAQQWAEEYEADFLESGAAVFRLEDLNRQPDGWRGLQPYLAPRRYVTAWDIGRRHDATVGITLDVTEPVHQVVAFERFERLPYPEIQRRIELRHKAYRGTHVVESNGVGDPVIENLDVRVEPFVTTTRSKTQAIQALQRAVEQSTFKHNLEALLVEQRLYEWDDQDLVQDCVMAAALAEYTAQMHAPQPYTVASGARPALLTGGGR